MFEKWDLYFMVNTVSLVSDSGPMCHLVNFTLSVLLKLPDFKEKRIYGSTPEIFVPITLIGEKRRIRPPGYQTFFMLS